MLKIQLSKIGNNLTCPAAIIVRSGMILVGLRNYTADKWKDISVWTLPGGRCEAGETVEAALRRETREEVGINDLVILDYIGEVPGAKKEDLVPLFFCSTNQEPTLMEPKKFSEWRWLPVVEYITGGSWAQMNPTAHRVISEFFVKSNLVH